MARQDIELRVQDKRTGLYRSINKKSYELAKHHYRVIQPGEDERTDEQKMADVLAENARLKAALNAKNTGEVFPDDLPETPEEATESEDGVPAKRRGRKSNAEKAAEAAAQAETNEQS